MGLTSTTAVVVPPEKAIRIDNTFEGLLALGCQHAKATHGIRDGAVLTVGIPTRASQRHRPGRQRQ